LTEYESISETLEETSPQVPDGNSKRRRSANKCRGWQRANNILVVEMGEWEISETCSNSTCPCTDRRSDDDINAAVTAAIHKNLQQNSSLKIPIKVNGFACRFARECFVESLTCGCSGKQPAWKRLGIAV